MWVPPAHESALQVSQFIVVFDTYPAQYLQPSTTLYEQLHMYNVMYRT